MRKRHRINRSKSKRSFTRNAMRINKRNVSIAPMRGGIRL